MYSNNHATLSLYKTCFKQRICDYIIHFHDEEIDIEKVVNHSYEIVKQVIDDYHQKDKTISGRLVAKVNYFHIEKEESVIYYHPSYRSEVIEDVETFYYSHMKKICDRMDNFNHHGSNFIIKNIQELHLHIMVMN